MSPSGFFSTRRTLSCPVHGLREGRRQMERTRILEPGLYTAVRERALYVREGSGVECRSVASVVRRTRRAEQRVGTWLVSLYHHDRLHLLHLCLLREQNFV